MENNKKGNKFLSGFANEKIIEDIYISDIKRLRPGTVVSENKNQYKIELGIPFMNENDIQVEVEKDKIIVNGKKRMKESDKGKQRKYKGIFQIPADVLHRDLNVSFHNRLLKIQLPKKKIVQQFQSTSKE